ncbi:arabinosaccharide transport system substrate-binding protein [Evansella vedderi]|uniref:Arabinosaccharide transport system substrate-binding protein n=1 Tax=Evansella vedderi TaxID=38282 RepID=A0ABT9ZQN3_9BACI|nr:sugar ABC transporter substrate-binding protein [Evansella vedderi]MDQ0253265.1 arabinosaccharide transport system substrate-binding protein [Evansella vedderi]
MSKLLKLGILLLISLTVLAGCGGSGGSGGEQTGGSNDNGGSEGEVTELTFWTFVGLHIEFFEEGVRSWNETYPDRQIKLNAESFPYDEMHNNLLLALQSGVGAPDIVDIEINRFPNFLQGDIQLEPLNDIIEPVAEDFVQSRFEIYSKDGQFYGAPTHVGASVAFYNTEIFNAAGVSPDDIDTWDDFVEIGKVIKAETDTPMTVAYTSGFWNFYPMISQRGSDIFDSNGDVILDNQDNIEVLQLIHDMVYEHEISVLAPGGNHNNEEFFAFMNGGGAASLIMPSWYASRFVEHMPDQSGNFVMKPMPRWEEGGFRSAGMGGTGTAVTKQSEHIELAKEFLAHAKLTEEANINIWKILGFDPPMHTVWESPELREPNRFTEYFGDGLFDMLLEIKDEINPLNITNNTPLARDLIETNVLHNTLRERSQTPEEALKQAADELRNR